MDEIKFEPTILYEDNHLLVVVKPQNMPVVSDDSKDLDLLTALKDYIKLRDGKPGNVFLGLVHRLDRPTTGVMVFAKTSKAASRLSEQLKSGQMKKNYFAIALGEMKQPAMILRHYLMKDEKTNTVRIATQSESGAKFAELSYKTVAYKNNLSLLDVDLKTGRSHQIRVQIGAGLGNVLYGDFKYGDKSHGGNLALCAYKLRLIHPTTKKIMTFVALPDLERAPWNLFAMEINDYLNIHN